MVVFRVGILKCSKFIQVRIIFQINYLTMEYYPETFISNRWINKIFIVYINIFNYIKRNYFFYVMRNFNWNCPPLFKGDPQPSGEIDKSWIKSKYCKRGIFGKVCTNYSFTKNTINWKLPTAIFMLGLRLVLSALYCLRIKFLVQFN